MIIVLHHNPQNSQLQSLWEGGDPTTALAILKAAVEMIEKQINAQSNGGGQQPRRPSGLIIPPTAIPRNIKGDSPDA